jgi:hypothetical protein
MRLIAQNIANARQTLNVAEFRFNGAGRDTTAAVMLKKTTHGSPI